MAKQLAESEYDKFHIKRIASVEEISDFDKAIKQIESTEDSR